MWGAFYQFIISGYNFFSLLFQALCNAFYANIMWIAGILTAIITALCYFYEKRRQRFERIKTSLSELKQYLILVSSSCNDDTLAVFTDELVEEMLREIDCHESFCLELFLNQKDKTVHLERIIRKARKNNKDVISLEDYSKKIGLLLDEIGILFPIYSQLLNLLFNLLLEYKKDILSYDRLFFVLNNNELNNIIQEQSDSLNDEASSSEEFINTKSIFRQIIFDYLKRSKQISYNNKNRVTEKITQVIQELLEIIIHSYSVRSEDCLYQLSKKQLKIYARNPNKNTKTICDCLLLFQQIQKEFPSEDSCKIIVMLGGLLYTLEGCDKLLSI
ncbi:MAG: hypothetical protein IKX40_13670 [Thermoguttaceae bacterium]|nr:hypothetical protein [Thermoguttaceae bacterium]